jgi:hypothetical protein
MFRPKRTKADLLSGCTKAVQSSRMAVGRSTVKVEYQDGTSALRYHDTDVITWDSYNGIVTLNSGGFRTSTTKDRINTYSNGIRIYQEKGNWFVSTAVEKNLLFYDGITFNSGGELVSEKKELDSKRINGIKKKISKFVKLVDSLDKVPFPNAGDCWYCSMFASKDNSHLKSHIDEGYMHGSLIYNALTEKGYIDPALIMQMNCKDSIKRAVRVYLSKRLLPDVCSR